MQRCARVPGAAKHALALAPVSSATRVGDECQRLSDSSPRTSPILLGVLLQPAQVQSRSGAPTNCLELARAGASLVVARKGRGTSAEATL